MLLWMWAGVSCGNHPCGVITAPHTIDDRLGLFTTTTDNYPISQLYMKEVDSLNYVKLDCLKLDTIELISNTCKAAGIEMLTPDNVDVNDLDVWNSMREDTTAIFQWEGDVGNSYIKRLMSDENIEKFKKLDPNFDRMTLLSIGNSAIRPAGASYREDLARGIVRKSGSEAIDDFLKPTFGYLVFQCQIIEFLHQYCGFTMGEADIVRRCVSEDTLITMANGKRKMIKDIAVGEQVMTLNEKTGTFTYNRVNDVFCNGKKNVLEVCTQHNHKLKLTPNHKVLTQRGWIEAGQLTDADYLMLPMRNHGYSDKKRPSERLQCTDMFLIGMLMGDGTIGGDRSTLRFTNSDLELVEKYKECVNHRLRGKPRCEFSIAKQKGVDVNYVYAVRIASLNYRNSVWDNLIMKLGINCKSAEKHIPEDLMNYPSREKLASLLGGLFSTDAGVIKASKAIEYYTISKELAYDVQFLLGKFGIYAYVYNSYVKDYNYDSYKVRISQKDSMAKFAEEVLPFVVGEKHKQYEEILEIRNEDTRTSIRFNYLMPRKYLEEIRVASDSSGVSLTSMGFMGGTNYYDSFSDVKIRRAIDKVYAPETYKLLMSEYMPIKIISIKDAGISNVYDLSVEENHNYIAEGLIVHNCFAKKLGTEDWLPIIENGGDNQGHHINGFVETMKEKYNMSENESKETIKAFIKVIDDASSYLFSLNHSQPYSYEGYVCAYLRYHYPLEFLTCSFNINKDNADKTMALTNYARKNNVKIEQPKFRYSKGDYAFSKENNAIYKGMSSIKNITDSGADDLYALRNNTYGSFTELLADIKETKVNSRQLDILIKLDFFSEFGEINALLQQRDIFDELYGKKQIKFEKWQYDPNILRECAGKCTEKMAKDFDSITLIRRVLASLEPPETTPFDRIKYEKEFLGYISTTIPDIMDDCYYVTGTTGYNNKTLILYNLKTGESLTIKNRTKKQKAPKEDDIIRIVEMENTKKYKPIGKDENGKMQFERIDEYETVLTGFSFVNIGGQ